MNFFLKKLGIFILFTFVVYAILLIVFSKFTYQNFKPNLKYAIGSYGSMNTRLHDLKSINKVDVLVLGSSHAYRGFDPRIFKDYGLSLFNLGSSAQTPIQTKLLLNRYLKNFKVKTIIYEIYPTTFSIDGVESSLDIIANDQNDFNSLKMAVTINHAKVYNTLAYGYISDVLKLNSSFKEPLINQEDKYITGGFVERKMTYYKPQFFNTKKIVFDDKQLKAFQEIVSIVKKKKINLILVYAPITSTLYKSYSNTPFFEKRIKRYGDYYNFNGVVPLNDSLNFYDSNHLNQSGVVLFNNLLIDSLFIKGKY